MNFMKKPVIGLTGNQSFTVDRSHCITFAGEGLPEVLSTPALIQYLELTARATVAPYLNEGEVTLGTSVEINHLAPSPSGQEIMCSARVVRVDGAHISFTLEARDRVETIAKGFHTRAVIQKNRFAKRVQRKQ